MGEKEFREGLSDILKRERAILELTQEQFSEIVDIEYKTYQSWELNKRNIKTSSFARMVKNLVDKSATDQRFEQIVKTLKEYIF